MDYHKKYLKYKNKYLELKGGSGFLLTGVDQHKQFKRINKDIEKIKETFPSSIITGSASSGRVNLQINIEDKQFIFNLDESYPFTLKSSDIQCNFIKFPSYNKMIGTIDLDNYNVSTKLSTIMQDLIARHYFYIPNYSFEMGKSLIVGVCPSGKNSDDPDGPIDSRNFFTEPNVFLMDTK